MSTQLFDLKLEVRPALAARADVDQRFALGPFVPGQSDAVRGGARVPGTALALDPIQAAFNTSPLIRWLDYNDTWLAAEWGHPSDNIGALLAVARSPGPHGAAARHGARA